MYIDIQCTHYNILHNVAQHIIQGRNAVILLPIGMHAAEHEKPHYVQDH